MLWKFVRLGLLTVTAVMGIILLYAAFMSDNLTKEQALALVMAADEPCRSEYAKALDLAGKNLKIEVREAGKTGQVICSRSAQELNKVKIFVSKSDISNARGKRDTIKACAALSRVRADLLNELGSDKPSQERQSRLDNELAAADADCQTRFKALAGG